MDSIAESPGKPHSNERLCLNYNYLNSQNWAEDPNRHFSKENIQIVNRHIKRYLALLLLLEKCKSKYNEVPPHMSGYHYYIKSTNNKCWRGYKEKGTLLHCWWECKLVQSLWKTVWRFLKKELPYDLAIPPLGIGLCSLI